MSRASFPPDRRVVFVDCVYRVLEGSGTIARAREVLWAAEQRHGVFLRPADDDRPHIDHSLHEDWFERNLYPFLDDTHITLAGGDFCNDVDVCDAYGAQLGETWRNWGGILADWANLRGWPATSPSAPKRWEYLDFYMAGYRGAELERYDEFARVVRAVIGVK
ncbi:hypothetical protein [Nannocystis punicea]|uniref:Barstar (barnase inhibitor) domain-containing protein n=1 Tax=Nannocystis punicea TaxID=2995304 RepID=A0ABY7HG83_9BACT|nr:hypothetical protein [Nannocystis poenicansa]WAS98087.1 hypothetical protein O0S08_18265 [Nannocystis poenicansa]